MKSNRTDRLKKLSECQREVNGEKSMLLSQACQRSLVMVQEGHRDGFWRVRHLLQDLIIPWKDSYISNRKVSTLRREFRSHTRNKYCRWSLMR